MLSTDHIETADEIEASLRKREEQFQQWAKSREAANTVTKSAPAIQGGQAVAHNMTAEWQSYIAAEIDRTCKSWVEAQMAAVGQVLAEERKRAAEEHAKMRVEFRAELDSLKIELLQTQLDEARGLPKRPLRVVGAVDVSSAIG